MLPKRSYFTNFLSKEREEINFSISLFIVFLNLPPHSFSIFFTPTLILPLKGEVILRLLPLKGEVILCMLTLKGEIGKRMQYTPTPYTLNATRSTLFIFPVP